MLHLSGWEGSGKIAPYFSFGYIEEKMGWDLYLKDWSVRSSPKGMIEPYFVNGPGATKISVDITKLKKTHYNDWIDLCIDLEIFEIPNCYSPQFELISS